MNIFFMHLIAEKNLNIFFCLFILFFATRVQYYLYQSILDIKHHVNNNIILIDFIN